jgi:hypothetical protein
MEFLGFPAVGHSRKLSSFLPKKEIAVCIWMRYRADGFKANGTDLRRKLQVLKKTRTWGFPQTPIGGHASPPNLPRKG